MKNIKRIICVMCLMCAFMTTVTYPVTTKVMAAKNESMVTINKTQLSLRLGQQKRLQVLGTDETVTWKSSDPKVVRVSKRGTVRSRRMGTATVTATIGKVTISCDVTVKKPVIIVEEYSKNYYTATYSDGFVVGASKENIMFAGDYKFYNVWAAYDSYVGAVYEQPLVDVTVKGYDTRTNESCKRTRFTKYSADWCEFQTNLYQVLDFDFNLKEFGKYYRMVDGYIAFKKNVKIDAIKYNDGIHKLTLFL